MIPRRGCLIVASKGEALGLLGSTFWTCGAGGHYHHYCNACISKAGYRSGVSHTIPVGEGFSNVYEEMGNYRSGAYMFKEHEEVPRGERR